MIATIKSTELKDLPALANFLIRIYKFAPSDYHADLKVLEWKYLCPRYGWNGSRSFVLEKDGQIVAHCGVCPVTFQLPGGDSVQSLTMMDWAADPSIPGVGMMLFRKLMAMAPTSFVIGGALVTRQIMPRIGFRQAGEAQTYAAWLRPWREFRVRGSTGRSALRLLHGWTHPVRKRSSGHWSATPVREFDDSVQSILNGRYSWTACKRTLDDLNYMLKCPQQKTFGFLLQREGKIAGYCIVGKSGWEARLLDVMVDSEDADDWTSACSTITTAIRVDPEVCRIRTLATVPILAQALKANGYWSQYTEPVFIYDPSRALERLFPGALQLFDGDAGY